MELKDLAPWIAIAFTLALSILVPLFTQIANNRHQRKMQREKFEYEQKQKKKLAFEEFLKNVGAAIASPAATIEALSLAGASIANIYIYAPAKWFSDLDALQYQIIHRNWDTATVIFQKYCHLISEELNDNKEKEQ